MWFSTEPERADFEMLGLRLPLLNFLYYKMIMAILSSMANITSSEALPWIIQGFYAAWPQHHYNWGVHSRAPQIHKKCGLGFIDSHNGEGESAYYKDIGVGM